MSVSNYLEPSSRRHFHVAIICATRIETNAVERIFDDVWEPQNPYGKAGGDPNSYHHGNSASSASALGISFPNLRLGLVVGICGGVPKINGRDDADTEVLLGDVIISTQVVQYKYGDQLEEGFEMKHTLDKARPEIRAFLGKLEGDYSHAKVNFETSAIMEEKQFKDLKYPGADRDRLYKPHYLHKHHRQEDHCETCNTSETRSCDVARQETCEALGCSEVIDRDRLVQVPDTSSHMLTLTAEGNAKTQNPELLVHLGPVASADVVMKSGSHRDEVASSRKVIAFEMEGAGVWENLQTIVIKGVSDYADSHKRDEWQRYAAARAAACTKATLKLWPPIVNSEAAATYKRQGSSRGHLLDEPRIHMRQDRTRESSRSDVGDKIDRAEALIKKRDSKTMRRDLHEARKILTQVLDLPETLSSDSLKRVYWGLMIAEKELSCDRSLNNEEKMLDIEKAEEWNSKLLSQNLDTSRRIHANLEKHIIQGRKASLELKREPGSLEASRSKDAAIEGIDKCLEELKEKDLDKYNDVERHARQWRARILETLS